MKHGTKICQKLISLCDYFTVRVFPGNSAQNYNVV